MHSVPISTIQVPSVLFPVFFKSVTGINNLIQSDQNSNDTSKMFIHSLWKQAALVNSHPTTLKYLSITRQCVSKQYILH